MNAKKQIDSKLTEVIKAVSAASCAMGFKLNKTDLITTADDVCAYVAAKHKSLDIFTLRQIIYDGSHGCYGDISNVRRLTSGYVAQWIDAYYKGRETANAPQEDAPQVNVNYEEVAPLDAFAAYYLRNKNRNNGDIEWRYSPDVVKSCYVMLSGDGRIQAADLPEHIAEAEKRDAAEAAKNAPFGQVSAAIRAIHGSETSKIHGQALIIEKYLDTLPEDELRTIATRGWRAIQRNNRRYEEAAKNNRNNL